MATRGPCEWSLVSVAPGMDSALIHFPVALAVVAELQQPVFRIVPLVAAWADQVAAPGCASVVVFFGDGKSGAATAWHEKHIQPRLRLCLCKGLLFGAKHG